MQPAPSDDRNDTRSRILDAADRLFGHFGYSKTTVADIARDLGMSPANVYRFFASKLEIVEAICQRLLAERQAYDRAIAAGEGSAAERLKCFFVENHRRNLESFVTDPRGYEIVEVAMAEDWPSIQNHLAKMADVIQSLIAEGVAAGEFLPPVDLRRAAICARQSFVSLFHPTLMRQCGTTGEMAGPEELADFIIAALKSP